MEPNIKDKVQEKDEEPGLFPKKHVVTWEKIKRGKKEKDPKKEKGKNKEILTKENVQAWSPCGITFTFSASIKENILGCDSS